MVAPDTGRGTRALGYGRGVPSPVVLGSRGMTIRDVVDVARRGVAVELAPDAVAAMAATRAHVEALAASDRPAYGVSTGFGGLATTAIPPDRRDRPSGR